jgi:hypothetical protein
MELLTPGLVVVRGDRAQAEAARAQLERALGAALAPGGAERAPRIDVQGPVAGEGGTFTIGLEILGETAGVREAVETAVRELPSAVDGVEAVRHEVGEAYPPIV